jgi:hypothetical protein
MIARRKIHVPVAALIFALCLASIDWLAILPWSFPDLQNYIAGFNSGWYLFELRGRGLLASLVAEGAWVYGFDALYALTNDIFVAFYIVSLVLVFLCSLYVTQRSGSPFYLLFLINPAFIEMAIGQIRSGLAAGIFYLALLIKNRAVAISLMIIAVGIHTAFGIFLGIFLLYQAYRSEAGQRMLGDRPVLVHVLIALIALAMQPIQGAVLGQLQDKRAEIIFDIDSGTLLAIAWLLLAGTYLILKRPTVLSWNYFLFVFASLLMAAAAISGNYGSRFASIALPAVAVMASELEKGRSLPFFGHYAAFTLVYFYFWLTFS